MNMYFRFDEEEETFKVSITASNSVSPGSPLTVTITDNDGTILLFIIIIVYRIPQKYAVVDLP